MLITPANLNLFFTAMESRFSQAFTVTEVWSERLATTYPVGTEQWVSGWIGMLDRLRLWKGPRITKTPAPQTYLVAVQPFELTYAVDKFKIEDDTYGIYFPLAEQMGAQARKWPDYALRDLIFGIGDYAAANIQLGTDGVAAWSASHPVDFYDPAKGTYTNDYRGGVTIDGITVGGAFSTNGFNTVYQDMVGRKSESGEALGIIPDLTVVPPQLKAAATTILQSQFYAPPMLGPLGTGAAGTPNGPFVGAMTNPHQGWTDLLVAPDFADYPNTWFMFATKGVIKPFSWLQRSAPLFVARTNPQDPVVFDQHTYVYGVEARGAPAWGLPFMSAVSGPTASVFS